MPKFFTEGKYLKHQELNGDTLMTIKEVKRETLEGEGGEQEKWVVYFEETKKGLALNATNGKTLCKLFGDEMDHWVGKQITLFVKEDVEFAGELVSAIRVRPKAPFQAHG